MLTISSISRKIRKDYRKKREDFLWPSLKLYREGKEQGLRS
jgi:hypothetical protein